MIFSILLLMELSVANVNEKICDPTPPVLNNWVIHLWELDLTHVPGSPDLSCLTASEQQQITRIRLPHRRRVKAWSRVMLRQLLGSYLTLPADEVCLWFGPHQRPHLDHRVHADTLNFNVTHSHQKIFQAVARTPLLGVDIERHRPLQHQARTLQRCCAPSERQHLAALDTSAFDTDFFRLWTAKEALLKAAGGSIFHAPSAIELNLASRPMHLIQAGDHLIQSHQWQLIEFDPGSSEDETLSGCLAVADGKWQVVRLPYLPADRQV